MESKIEGITAVSAAGIKHFPFNFIYNGIVEFESTFMVIINALDTMPVNNGEDIIYELFFKAKLKNFFELFIILSDHSSYSICISAFFFN